MAGKKLLDGNKQSAETRGEWYSRRRDELSGLLGEALGLDIGGAEADVLRLVEKKCRENAFEVVFMGEFQGGKSTTFDALCDGRELSPRGNGAVKTSAAIISAQNISDGETKEGMREWAELTWKTPRDIALGLYCVLAEALGEDRNCLAGISPDESSDGWNSEKLAERLDLRDKTHKETVAAALHLVWQKYLRDKAAFDQKLLDQLRISTLIVRFHGGKEWAKFTSTEVTSVEQFQQYVAFPKDWGARWKAGELSEFEPGEVSFVFLKSVLLRIHSRNLERLGCRITDCPGLFANAYDTEVARRAAQNADAVWYLVDGERQIGSADLAILRTLCHDWGYAGKISATCNYKTDKAVKTAEVFEKTREVLADSGFDFNVYPYNAKLAFLAMRGETIVSNPEALTKRDLEALRSDKAVKGADVDDAGAWTLVAASAGRRTGVEALKAVTALDAKSIALVRAESFLDGILPAVERFILEKKAASILIDNGSERAAAALVSCEGILAAREDAAKSSELEWYHKTEELVGTLREFVDESKKSVEECRLFEKDCQTFTDSLSRAYLEDVLSSQCLEDVAADFSRLFDAEARKFHLTRARTLLAVAPKLSEALLAQLKNSVGRVNDLWGEPDCKGLADVRAAIAALVRKINKQWGEHGLDEEALFSGFEFLPNPEFIMDDERLSKAIRGFLSVDVLSRMFGRQYEGIGNLIMRWFTTEETRAEARRAAMDDIKAKLKEELFGNTSRRAELRGWFADVFKDELNRLKESVEDKLNGLEGEFRKSRIEPARKNFKKSQKERNRIATESQEVREGKIEPLRKRIETFRDAVKAELAVFQR